MAKVVRILKPLLILPPTRMEFETVNKRMSLLHCQKCGEKFGKQRLSITQGSGRSVASVKLCGKCGDLVLNNIGKLCDLSAYVARMDGVIDTQSPRAYFREHVEPFLSRRARCPACNKIFACDPSGKMRKHKDERDQEGEVCKGTKKISF